MKKLDRQHRGAGGLAFPDIDLGLCGLRRFGLGQGFADIGTTVKCSLQRLFESLRILANGLVDVFTGRQGIGDGSLRYYLYNWRLAQELEADEVGLVLL